MRKTKRYYFIQGSEDAIFVQQHNHYAIARKVAYEAGRGWQARAYMKGFETCNYELTIQGTSPADAHWVATGITKSFTM